MKPTSKAPGSERLILKCDDLLSNFALNINLRRYSTVDVVTAASTLALAEQSHAAALKQACLKFVATHLAEVMQTEGRSLHSSTFQLNLSHSTGAKVEAWCLLIHADAYLFLSLPT
jgi:predicted metal-binding membrane protein